MHVSQLPMYGRAPSPKGLLELRRSPPHARLAIWRTYSENLHTPGIEPGTSQSPGQCSLPLC